MNTPPSTIAPELTRKLWEKFDVDLDTLVESIDTAPLANIFPDRPTRALVVVNHWDDPFSGIARLDVDFRTRAALDAIVFTPEGEILPSRLVDESRGAIDDDGKFRWTFALEFAVEIGTKTARAFGSVWQNEQSPGDGAALWTPADALFLPAFETLCHPGNLPNPYSFRL